MYTYEIKKIEHPLNSVIEIPGSKSYTNRALVMAALTKGLVTLHNPLYCDDTAAMIECLRTLGLRIDTLPKKINVYDDISIIREGSYELFAHHSGTTLRFLLPLLCLTPGTKVIKGSARLNERPIKDLVDALRQLGASIDYLEREGQAPLMIRSSTLAGNEVSLDASISSQFASALLMVAPMLNGLTMQLAGALVSKPYVDMTIEMMQEWKINVSQKKENEIVIDPKQCYQKNQYIVEGDYSSAGYFFAIAALTQSSITIKNLNPVSAQADRKFLMILEKMGNKIILGDQTITMQGNQILSSSLEMEDCPDQVQTMAVLAAFARGVTRISGVRSLRLKETERVHALRIELGKMGIQTEDTHDTLTIFGGTPQAATIDTYGDHRMAMAFAVAGTKLSGMKVRCPEVVNKTFPTFWETLRSL